MTLNKPHWVYVIQNSEGRFYIGISIDPESRLTQHNNGESKWTRKYLPWHLVWTKQCPSLTEARKIENLLKRQKGGQGFYNYTGLQRGSGRSSSGS
ncbi:MAG: GIY-YIG nuclease family protein [Limisphaerales bacterium]|jgi:putative endonuclease